MGSKGSSTFQTSVSSLGSLVWEKDELGNIVGHWEPASSANQNDEYLQIMKAQELYEKLTKGDEK